MADQSWTQTFPNPGLDPGFRVDPRGEARFLVRGVPVDVVVKYIEDDSDRVEVTASVTLSGVKVVESSTEGEWGESYTLRDLLDSLLNDVSRDVGRQVRRINEQLARFEPESK